jgi:hypothetical protein
VLKRELLLDLEIVPLLVFINIFSSQDGSAMNTSPNTVRMLDLYFITRETVALPVF